MEKVPAVFIDKLRRIGECLCSVLCNCKEIQVDGCATGVAGGNCAATWLEFIHFAWLYRFVCPLGNFRPIFNIIMRMPCFPLTVLLGKCLRGYFPGRTHGKTIAEFNSDY